MKQDDRRDKILETARGYLGTPWVHCGKDKKTGVDCAGLLYCIRQDLNMPVDEYEDYSKQDEFENMMRHINKFGKQQEMFTQAGSEKAERFNIFDHVKKWKKSDVLIFRARKMFNHCAIYNGEGGMIHAYNGAIVKAVVEHEIDFNWYSRLYARYSF